MWPRRAPREPCNIFTKSRQNSADNVDKKTQALPCREREGGSIQPALHAFALWMEARDPEIPIRLSETIASKNMGKSKVRDRTILQHFQGRAHPPGSHWRHPWVASDCRPLSRRQTAVFTYFSRFRDLDLPVWIRSQPQTNK